MAGIIDLNMQYGNEAITNLMSSERQRAALGIYNEQVRRQNMEEVGKALAGGGQATESTAKKADEAHQQNLQNNQNQQGIAQTAQDNPNDSDPALKGYHKGEDNENAGKGGSGLSRSQYASVLGTFLGSLFGQDAGGSGSGTGTTQ